MTRRLLVVDDDPAVRTSLSEALREGGIDVSVAEDGARALVAIGKEPPDIVLCDVRMPEIDGHALLQLLRERTPDIDVILMTAYDDMPTVVNAMRGGAVEFLVKPIDLDRLLAVVGRAFDDRQVRRRSSRVEQTAAEALRGLVGHDPRMIDVYKLVGQAAPTRATVLVRGESGTGKELIARAIHDNSTAASEPFVPVNCAALPSLLLESELFGHVRGAFTGASEARRGSFSIAGRGTIFLDEIGDTSLDFQSKLLRVIDDRAFLRVGAERAEPTEARVVAATHRNVEELVAAGRFREDLYYRLRVVEIRIPPLRERAGDIPLLVAHMLRRAARSLETAEPVLSRAALDQLMAHDWPGNVRELENCLMRAVVVAAGNVIRPEHLTLSSPRARSSPPLSSLDQIERDQIVRVLAATDGHKARAADVLGVSRPRLNRLIEKHGLEP
jgi:DNA-binding NtrC family response regulator